MLDWVKRSFQLYAVRHAKVDMRRQIDVYAGMDDSEVAFLLVAPRIVASSLSAGVYCHASVWT